MAQRRCLWHRASERRRPTAKAYVYVSQNTKEPPISPFVCERLAPPSQPAEGIYWRPSIIQSDPSPRRDLVIHPDECIDCGVCEPECPAEAILPDTEGGLEKWMEINATYSAQWPNITMKGETPDDADSHKGEEGKFDKYFTQTPGKGS